MELHFAEAHVLARMLRAGEISAYDVMASCLAQIERVNPHVNAIVTMRDPSTLLDAARAADREIEQGRTVGPLHGLPVAIKDLLATRGIRTTYGSLAFRDFVPATDDLSVERILRAGAIVVGKTNTPELGAGSQTFNRVFGATANPYDPARTCGGSSGGSAVALACGMVPLADGTDLGGSLRNPASFCNVVGFRPSPGRVARVSRLPWDTLSVQGPMGRSVADAALLLSVMAGPDRRDPIALDEPAARFSESLDADFNGTPIAFSGTLGRYPVQSAVAAVCRDALAVFERLGCDVVEQDPDMGGVDEIFRTLRAALFAAQHRELLRTHRAALKDTVVWNIERGLELTATDVAAAEEARGELYRRISDFLERYRFLILPVSQVAPFPIEEEWVREIDGVELETYIDWMGTCYAVSVTGLPAISVPCGFTAAGLPIGLQIVGRRHADAEVLALAYAFEQATLYGRRRPSLAAESAHP
jgi:amidase